MLTVRSRLCTWPPRSAALSLLSQWRCCVCFVTFLHMNFSSTPNSILNLTISQESQSITEFYDTFGVGKYCQLFTHELTIDQYAISALYSPPNCPVPFDDHHQNLIHPFRARPTHHPKRHPGPISRVATAHMCGPTDGDDECSIGLPIALCSAILIASDALIIPVQSLA